jgi:hypothetical protein
MVRGDASPLTAVAPIQVRVVGPDSVELQSVELSRLAPGRPVSRLQREHLEHATRVVARVGDRVVGVAAYERLGNELRVLDLRLDPVPPPLCGTDVVRQLLDALEVAALAGGCRRIVLLPAAVIAATSLERLGYRIIAEGCAGGWLEKDFSG